MNDMMDIKTAQARVGQLEAENARLREAVGELVARIDSQARGLIVHILEPELTAARSALGHQLTTSTNM